MLLKPVRDELDAESVSREAPARPQPDDTVVARRVKVLLKLLSMFSTDQVLKSGLRGGKQAAMSPRPDSMTGQYMIGVR